MLQITVEQSERVYNVEGVNDDKFRRNPPHWLSVLISTKLNEVNLAFLSRQHTSSAGESKWIH